MDIAEYSKIMTISDPSNIKSNESSPVRVILESMLLPDEHVLQIAKISAGIYWKTIAVFCLAVLFITTALSFDLPTPLFILLVVAMTIKIVVMGILAYLTKHYLLLAVTDKRVIMRVGIINLEIAQMRYAQIESSEIASTIPGRLLGYSNVFVSGTGGRTLAVPFIMNAIEIRKSITEILSSRDDAELH